MGAVFGCARHGRALTGELADYGLAMGAREIVPISSRANCSSASILGRLHFSYISLYGITLVQKMILRQYSHFVLTLKSLTALLGLTTNGNLLQFRGKHSHLRLCPALHAFQRHECPSHPQSRRNGQRGSMPLMDQFHTGLIIELRILLQFPLSEKLQCIPDAHPALDHISRRFIRILPRQFCQ